MIYDEIIHADAARVRWLCSASDEAARELCADAHVSDPAEVHCARFALLLVQGTALPPGYAWDVFRAPAYAAGKNALLAPLEGHVRLMAFAAADLTPGLDPLEFIAGSNHGLSRLAVRRFGSSPHILPDARLTSLADHESFRVRSQTARMLRWREPSVRNPLLLQMMHDRRGSVRSAAERTAASTGDEELRGTLAARGEIWALSWCGDARGRPYVEALVDSEDVLSHEWAVHLAAKLGVRDLLARLWTNREWYTRSNALVAAASQHMLDAQDLAEILVREGVDYRIELMTRWPQFDREGLLTLARSIREQIDNFPTVEALLAGSPEVIEAAREWIAGYPELTAAIVRLVPHETAVALSTELLAYSEPSARRAGILAVQRRDLRQCFPTVAELCADADESVVREACRTVEGDMNCGIYGLDTAVLAARDDMHLANNGDAGLARMLEVLVGEKGHA